MMEWQHEKGSAANLNSPKTRSDSPVQAEHPRICLICQRLLGLWWKLRPSRTHADSDMFEASEERWVRVLDESFSLLDLGYRRRHLFKHFARVTQLLHSARHCDLCKVFASSITTTVRGSMFIAIKEHGLILVRQSSIKTEAFEAIQYFQFATEKDWAILDEVSEPSADPSLHLHRVLPSRDSIRAISRAARQMLAWCEENHTQCVSRTNSFLPRRLVHVGSNQCSTICLVDTETLPRGSRFAALSYVWGRIPNAQRYRLTERRLQMYQGQIPHDVLPRTILDAILFVREIGLLYIWIDALCIIQDSDSDWHTESHTMAQTYIHASFCVSAAVAVDAEGGMFNEQASMNSTRLIELGAEAEAGYVFVQTSRASLLEDAMAPSMLTSRAWTLQESRLSSRVIHITPWQLILQCARGLCSESAEWQATTTNAFHYNYARPIVSSAIDNGNNLETWYWIIVEYCSRNLSYQEDRQVAFEGIRQLFDQALGQDYFYGLRGSDAYNSLLWHRCEPSISASRRIWQFKETWIDDDRGYAICPLLPGDSSWGARGLGAGHENVVSKSSVSKRTRSQPSWSWLSASTTISFCRLRTITEDDGDVRVSDEGLRFRILRTGHLSIQGYKRPYVCFVGSIVGVLLETDTNISKIFIKSLNGRRSHELRVPQSIIWLDEKRNPLHASDHLRDAVVLQEYKDRKPSYMCIMLLIERVGSPLHSNDDGSWSPEPVHMFRRVGLALAYTDQSLEYIRTGRTLPDPTTIHLI